MSTFPFQAEPPINQHKNTSSSLNLHFRKKKVSWACVKDETLVFIQHYPWKCHVRLDLVRNSFSWTGDKEEHMEKESEPGSEVISAR